MLKTVTNNSNQTLTNKHVDAQNNTFVDIGINELANTYKAVNIISSLEVDWNLAQGFTKELPSNSELTFTNLFIGTKDIILSGNFTLLLPSWVKIIEGEYLGDKTNQLQINCTNATPGQEEAWCSFISTDIVKEATMFFDIIQVSIPASLEERNTANGTLEITNSGDAEGTQPIEITWYKNNIKQFDYVTLVTIAAGAAIQHNISDYFGSSTEGIWHIVATSFNDVHNSNSMEITAVPQPAYVYFIRIDLPTPRMVGEIAAGTVRTFNLGDFETTQDILIIWKKDGNTMYQHTYSNLVYAAKAFKYLATSLELLSQHIGTGWTIEAYSDDDSIISSEFEITEALLSPAYFKVDNVSVPINLNVNDTASSIIEITNTGEVEATQDVIVTWKKDGVNKFTETETITLGTNESTSFQSLLTLIEEHIGTGWTITVESENESLISLPFEVFFAAVACDGSTSYPGGISYPTIQEINLGTDIGDVTFYFNANGIPDKFQVFFDGVKVIDTGYRGSVHYQDDLDTAILSYDPTYDKINAQEQIDPQYLGEMTFSKDSHTTVATVYVYAPMQGTGWDFTLFCPNQAK